MGNHTLQLVAIEQPKAAARDADRHVALRVAGGKAVDAALVVQHINLGHRHAGSDGHLLDDVAQLLLVRTIITTTAAAK